MPRDKDGERANISLSKDWLIAIGLSLGGLVSLSLSRFAYALLLPGMRHDLHWTYAIAAGMNTANAAGYIVGAIGAGGSAKLLGPRRAFTLSLVVGGLCILFTGLTTNYLALSLWRSLGGVANAITFIVGASLASSINGTGNPARSSFLVSIYFGGVGAGIVLSGVAIHLTQAALGSDAWQASWIVLGTIAVACSWPAGLAAARVDQVGAKPVASISAREFIEMIPVFLAYLLFGAGSMSYMTFAIALVQRQGMEPWIVTLFWILLGAASVLAVNVWGRFLNRSEGGLGLAAASFLTFLGSVPFLLFPGVWAAFVFAVLFGGSLIAGPTAITILVRKLLRQQAWTAAIAGLTIAFSLGQVAGPLASGLITDYTGSLSSGLWLSSIMLILAAVICFLQKSNLRL
ncbi:MAG: major facilitator superfamily 1 [Herminiimonas sp.]|nr:major facilitator superfamily 1 [Herminiimonas sp.]